jgi:hypothetical protein
MSNETTARVIAVTTDPGTDRWWVRYVMEDGHEGACSSPDHIPVGSLLTITTNVIVNELP